MDIDLELYRVFNAVVRAGTLSGAAKELFISQPAVSQAVKQLETGLGTRLFARTPHGVALTREGEVLYGYTRSALSLISSGERRITSLSELESGELRIGAGDTVSKWYLLPVINEFHRLHPQVSLSITNRTSDDTVALLKAGRIDIGFVNMPMSTQGVIFEECRVIHDVFVAADAFSALRGRLVAPAELAEYPLIMLERASNSRRWVDRHFLAAGVDLRAGIELGAHDLLVDYARIGLGAACVIREFVGDASGLFTVDLTPPVPERAIGACYLEALTLSAAARRFIDLTKRKSP